MECLVNLSGIKGNQDDLMKLGCSRVLTRLVHGSDCDPETKALVLLTISNLADCLTARVKLVDPGQSVVPCLLSMAGARDSRVKKLCAVGLCKLAADPTCAAKIVLDQ
jgi:hypothetical protein